MKKTEKRSECPISLSLDLFGDKWSLLIIRDIVFKGYHFYNEFLESGEGIATNVLSDRLKKLELNEFLISEKYQHRKTKKVYQLTEKGIGLIPILLEMIAWGFRNDDTLLIPDDRTSIVDRIWNDKEALLEEITASVRSFDSQNFC
ncbi:helix-turn-helix domain-containing protein [Galbibacter sp. EGI 63066]|uniref:winged helix-turn-helix transcriptional regulator n=1 Tax=Galbibacter sp. EGI 63066 TaxID=2993559 RepID=UPI0022492E68|nr:helix-turn-helix domain-containing protein [Galbibacter sp. EGI 63066]MCX2681317.1 helix-turn-helix domain-containing protein [Galbibacter sp. EGI 63066]